MYRAIVNKRDLNQLIADNAFKPEIKPGGEGGYSYSIKEEPVQIGFWDDKPLYQLRIPYDMSSISIPSNDSYNILSNKIPSIDRLIDVKLISDNGNAYTIPVQYVGGNGYITLLNNVLTNQRITIDYVTDIIIIYTL